MRPPSRRRRPPSGGTALRRRARNLKACRVRMAPHCGTGHAGAADRSTVAHPACKCRRACTPTTFSHPTWVAQVVYTLPQGLDPDDALFSESGAMNIMFFMDKACPVAPVQYAQFPFQTCTTSILSEHDRGRQHTSFIACSGPNRHQCHNA